MDRWIKAGVVENRFEGDRVSQALDETQIPFLIKSFLDTAYDGLYIPQKGWGAVMVPEGFRDEAEKVISEVKRSFRKEEEMSLNSMDEILRFAIRKEADAAAFYHMAADRSNPGVRKTFEELAKEEEGHKEKLEVLDLKKIDQIELKEVKGLGLSEMMEDVPYSPDMNYADLLRMAIKNEEKSQHLYTSSAKIVKEPKLEKLFLILAQEESKHKVRLEKIYDEEILKEF